MKKIGYFLLSASQMSNRQDNILNTWGKEKDVFFMSEHEDPERKVIKVCEKHHGGYWGLPTKLMFVFRKIQESFFNDYEWFFIGDDDTFVNTILLELEIDCFDKNFVHGVNYGPMGGWSISYPSGGAGCVISREIIQNFFYDYSLSHFYGDGHRYADVNLGYNMNQKNILLISNSKFNGENPNFYKIEIDDCYQYYTFHRITTFDEMNHMNNICLRNLNLVTDVNCA